MEIKYTLNIVKWASLIAYVLAAQLVEHYVNITNFVSLIYPECTVTEQWAVPIQFNCIDTKPMQLIECVSYSE